MVSLILSFGAILLSNYYQIIEYQLFDPHGSLFIYTNSESVVYCSEGNWTFLSSDQEINCIDIVNSLPHINNSHIILGIHRVQEYFLLPPAQNLCMSLYGDNLILHVGSQTLECFPYLTLGNIIQFDPFLLVNWKSIFSGYDFDVRGNWHLVCASLESSLLGHAYPESNYFSIISAIDFNINSIAFWLNLCHLDSKITTIYQRSILSSVSTCVVDQVKGPFISQKEEPLICIEDIFSQLPSEFPVVYISPMGIDFLEQMNTELSYQQHIADIYSIILATLNQDRGSTVLCITAGLRGLITSLTHQFSQHNLEEQFLTLFRSTDLNEWVNSFASFTFTMNNIFVLSDNKDDSQSKVDLFFRLADRNLFMNHFDEVFEKVSFSHNSANEIIVSNPLMKYLLGETLIRFLRYLSLASKFYSLDSFHLYLHHAGAHLMETPASITMCNASEILSYDISTFSVVSTTTHIVIFVSPSELEEARSILQEWRSSCQYCPLVIHYIIYVIPNSQDLDIMTSTNHEFRQILLTLQDYLFRLVVNSDIAVCLVGINSMRSFIHAGDDGLLPFPVIGGVSYVRLFSSLVFASKIYNINPSLSCLEANFNAFVGTSSQLVHFLSYVLNEANIGLSDNFLRWKTLQYLHTFKDSYNIKIDSHFKFFNFFVRYRSPTFEQDLSILVTRSLDYHSTISIAQEAIFSSPNILVSYRHFLFLFFLRNSIIMHQMNFNYRIICMDYHYCTF